MLIEFSVENYRSFRDRKTLSMEATGVSEYPENVSEAQNRRYKLLKGAVIYGANSSGKSNLVRAFEAMRGSVLHTRFLRVRNFSASPHLLFTPNIKSPIKLEVIFVLNDNNKYRYGFEILDGIVLAEWLYRSGKVSEKMIFIRQGKVIEISDVFTEGQGIEDKTREDRLFLQVVSEFNGAISRKISEWFSNSKVVSGLQHNKYAASTISGLKNPLKKAKIIELYNKLSLGFNNVEIEVNTEMWSNDDGEVYSETTETPMTYHTMYDEQFNSNGETKFQLESNESDGTKKLFNLSGNLFESLDSGSLLVIDEFDSSLHPLIMLTITRLFNSEKTNPHNAQLIYTTHDTNMLQYGNYRRDQVWFTEKDKYGGTDLYSLVEIKDKPRAGADFENQYIKGRYGAIPYIGNIEKLFEEWHKREK